MNETIYFGRPISTYDDVELEARLIPKILLYFGIAQNQLVDPKSEIHQHNVSAYKNKGLNPMEYFYREILPHVSSGVFLAFVDSMFGIGVWSEAHFLMLHGKPIFEIKPDGKIIPMELDEARKLSLAETRVRVHGHTNM